MGNSMGVFLGSSYSPFCCVVMADNGKFLEVRRLITHDWLERKSTIESLSNKWSLDKFFVDQSFHSDSDVEALWADGAKCYPVNANKRESPLIWNLYGHILDNNTGTRDYPILFDQIGCGWWDTLPTGIRKWRCDPSVGSDAVIAAALALHGQERSGIAIRTDWHNA